MTTSNALVIDILPRLRQGEGLGYFGLSGTIAMALGPLISILIYTHFAFVMIFYVAIISGIIGCFFALFLKVKYSKVKKEPISIDRFFLLKGIPIGLNYVLLAIPYSTITTYIAIYATSIGQNANSGLFFIIMSIGLIISRIFAGRNVDKGKILETIKFGIVLSAASLFLLYLADKTQQGFFIFYISAFLLGLSYGVIFPSFNVMFVNLAPNNRRAAASSTYLISWDIGIGTGIVIGGKIIDSINISSIYAMGGVSAVIAAICFIAISVDYFEKNKLR
jgi:predicted MFS family arabinose efflux permease